jgi:hypothetical protein
MDEQQHGLGGLMARGARQAGVAWGAQVLGRVQLATTPLVQPFRAGQTLLDGLHHGLGAISGRGGHDVVLQIAQRLLEQLVLDQVGEAVV